MLAGIVVNGIAIAVLVAMRIWQPFIRNSKLLYFNLLMGHLVAFLLIYNGEWDATARAMITETWAFFSMTEIMMAYCLRLSRKWSVQTLGDVRLRGSMVETRGIFSTSRASRAIYERASKIFYRAVGPCAFLTMLVRQMWVPPHKGDGTLEFVVGMALVTESSYSCAFRYYDSDSRFAGFYGVVAAVRNCAIIIVLRLLAQVIVKHLPDITLLF